MSIGVKTANGDVKIHSVHVVPADGYTSDHGVMENIWNNDYGYTGTAEYKNCLVEYTTSGNKADYVNSANPINLGLKLTEIDSTEAPKILTTIAPTSNNGSYRRYNNTSGIYPNKRETIYSYAIQYSTGGEFILNQSAFGTVHPAIVDKPITSNVWLTKIKDLFLYDFHSLITLTGYTFTGGEKLILITDSYNYTLWIIPDGTTFTLTNDSLRPSNSLRKWDMSKSSYFGNNIRTAKVNIAINSNTWTATIAVSSILAATFDIKLTDETLVYSKNADVSDFVDLT